MILSLPYENINKEWILKRSCSNLWIKLFFLAFVILLSNACAYSKVTKGAHVESSQKPSGDDQIFVMLAADGTYGTINYYGSGRQVSIRTLEIIRHDYPLAQLLDAHLELEAIQKCKELGVNYLLNPSILHWEDRLTAWSSFRDKVRVGLRLIILKPYSVLSACEFESRNNSITFLNTQPQDLLDEDFEEAVMKLFR